MVSPENWTEVFDRVDVRAVMKLFLLFASRIILCSRALSRVYPRALPVCVRMRDLVLLEHIA